ncbi:unnamed protein product [Cuscuta epithymum]|uniref:Uncharacterized protein n=1 Tax=Cuscuta epithymum TaxID=186058 RepID=A0AAV0CRJ6_9ASTE|nr:unnamed protein product [Cuscuta epithymum]
MVAVKKEPVVVPLKLLIDEKNNRVLAAEANKDFVEILFSFLTFPMGTIIRLITSAKDEPTASVTIGCMNKLYTGIQNLSSEYWQTEYCKNMLLNPRNHLAQYCKKLKINIDDSGSELSYACNYQGCPYHSMYRNVRCLCGRGMTTQEKPSVDSSSSSNQGAAFLTGGIEFLISDDLQVRPASPAVFAELIPDLGSGDCSAMPIREMHLDVSKAQVINRPLINLITTIFYLFFRQIYRKLIWKD